MASGGTPTPPSSTVTRTNPESPRVAMTRIGAPGPAYFTALSSVLART